MLMLYFVSFFFFSIIQVNVAVLSLKYTVFEEQNLDTRIGNVIKDSKVDKDFIGGNNCKLFDVDNFPKTSNLIKINSTTCELLVNRRIDREDICTGEKCSLPLSVYIAQQIWVNVLIEILDINDHAPRFEPSIITLSIPENSPIGFSFDLPLAQDPDQSQNTIQSYILQPLITQFDLFYTPLSSLRLSVNSDLDYEQPSMRNFTSKIIACDWGSPKLCGNLDIHILVADLNDNRPSFLNHNVTVDVMEDSSVGRLVTTVMAQDYDDGANGYIVYIIVPTLSNKPALGFFSINSTSGQIFLSKSLQSFDAPEMFKLNVIAKDHGLIPLSSECVIIIRVVDVNNHAPIITVTPTLGAILQISEGMPSGTTVGLVKVTDRDKGDNGLVSCELSMDRSMAILEAWNIGSPSKMYKLLVSVPLDREETLSLNISLICTDRGVPPRTTEKELTIMVIDINEYDPVLKFEPSYIMVAENLRINATIAAIYPTDKDSDAKLMLKLESNNDLFWIDSKGRIRLSQNIDRETRPMVSLSVIAIDNGPPNSRTASLLLTINIADVNDNEPQLLEPRSFQLLENLGVSPSRIGQLKAFDPDLGLNGTVRFSLLRATSLDNYYLNNTFYIDEKNGSIFSLKPIDRETVPSISLRILLTDLGSPPLSREEVVHLTVVDENDNVPMWQFPSTENSNINMSVLADSGRYDHRPVLITIVRVIDTDSPHNANISFKLLSATSNNIPVHAFSLDSVTGHLTSFGPISEGLYVIQMQASDNGRPPLISEIGTLYLKVFSPKQYFFNSDADRLSITLIIALGSVTCIICVSLVIAIIVVRRHRYGATQFISNGHQNDQNSVANESLAKWTEEQNQYLDSWGYQSQYCSYPMISPHYKLSSIGEPLLPPPGPNDVLSTMSSQPHMCSMMHLRRPTNQDMDVSSADSGRGASEEENFHPDGKMKEMVRPRGRQYATLPTASSLCSCQNSGTLCNQCITNIAAQYQYTGYCTSPSVGEPLFHLPKPNIGASDNNYTALDTIVTASSGGAHIQVLSSNSPNLNNYCSEVSSFYNHTNV